MWYAEKTRCTHIGVHRIFNCWNKYLPLHSSSWSTWIIITIVINIRFIITIRINIMFIIIRVIINIITTVIIRVIDHLGQQMYLVIIVNII